MDRAPHISLHPSYCDTSVTGLHCAKGYLGIPKDCPAAKRDLLRLKSRALATERWLPRG